MTKHRRALHALTGEIEWSLIELLFFLAFFCLMVLTNWLPGQVFYCDPYVTREYCARFDNEAIDETFMFDWRKD